MYNLSHDPPPRWPNVALKTRKTVLHNPSSDGKIFQESVSRGNTVQLFAGDTFHLLGGNRGISVLNLVAYVRGIMVIINMTAIIHYHQCHLRDRRQRLVSLGCTRVTSQHKAQTE